MEKRKPHYPLPHIKAAFADAGSLNRSFVSKQGADDLNMDDNAVPVVIRAIRQRCGLTQREAGLLFGTGGKSFEKYESGEIQPSAPTKRLLKLAMERPELFSVPENRQLIEPSTNDQDLVRAALSAAHVDQIYERLFAEP